MSELLSQNYCRILGVNQDASLSQIKRAYRTKAKEYHPDMNKSPNANLQFIIINEAYVYLINELTRKTDSILGSKKANSRDRRYGTRQSGSVYDEWINKERAKARAQASRHAEMRFSEFKKTKIYKTSKILSEAIDYLYMMAGVLIMLSPIFYTYYHGIDKNNFGRSIASIIAAFIIGCVIIGMIGHTKIRLIKNRKRIRHEREFGLTKNNL